MAPIKSRKIDTALLRKGFVPDSGDHKFYVLVAHGKTTGIFTKISRGHEEVSDKNLGRMARQLRIRRKDFEKLVDCSWSEEDYVARLEQEGKL